LARGGKTNDPLLVDRTLRPNWRALTGLFRSYSSLDAEILVLQHQLDSSDGFVSAATVLNAAIKPMKVLIGATIAGARGSAM